MRLAALTLKMIIIQRKPPLSSHLVLQVCNLQMVQEHGLKREKNLNVQILLHKQCPIYRGDFSELTGTAGR